jgi:hypothetical protein
MVSQSSHVEIDFVRVPDVGGFVAVHRGKRQRQHLPSIRLGLGEHLPWRRQSGEFNAPVEEIEPLKWRQPTQDRRENLTTIVGSVVGQDRRLHFG